MPEPKPAARSGAREPQTTGTVLLVRPAAFGYDEETAATNSFQRRADGLSPAEIEARARAELDGFARLLRAAGVDVVAVEDRPEPRTPSAVFPNNWLSTHADGRIVLYPMQTGSRRAEVRADVVDLLRSRFGFERVLDLRAAEAEGRFLEGTGSLVLDRAHGVAYACPSPRTDVGLARRAADELGCELVTARARDRDGNVVYHTNVALSVGQRCAVVCLEALDPVGRERVRSRLEADGHELIEIDPDQMHAFAGNVLALSGRDGPLIAMSTTARDAFTPSQRERLAAHGRIVAAPLATIERCGGGSARCTLAEVFAPRLRS